MKRRYSEQPEWPDEDPVEKRPRTDVELLPSIAANSHARYESHQLGVGPASVNEDIDMIDAFEENTTPVIAQQTILAVASTETDMNTAMDTEPPEQPLDTTTSDSPRLSGLTTKLDIAYRRSLATLLPEGMHPRKYINAHDTGPIEDTEDWPHNLIKSIRDLSGLVDAESAAILIHKAYEEHQSQGRQHEKWLIDADVKLATERARASSPARRGFVGEAARRSRVGRN